MRNSKIVKMGSTLLQIKVKERTNDICVETKLFMVPRARATQEREGEEEKGRVIGVGSSAGCVPSLVTGTDGGGRRQQVAALKPVPGLSVRLDGANNDEGVCWFLLACAHREVSRPRCRGGH